MKRTQVDRYRDTRQKRAVLKWQATVLPEQRSPQQHVTTPHTAQLIHCTAAAKRNAHIGHKTHKIRTNDEVRRHTTPGNVL
jgi:hypothetical protein